MRLKHEGRELVGVLVCVGMRVCAAVARVRGNGPRLLKKELAAQRIA